jgi:hypothetical protein
MIAINLSMEQVGLKPKKSERVRRFLEFIFGFENKRGEVLYYWIYSADGFNIALREFYTAVEKKLSG